MQYTGTVKRSEADGHVLQTWGFGQATKAAAALRVTLVPGCGCHRGPASLPTCCSPPAGSSSGPATRKHSE